MKTIRALDQLQAGNKRVSLAIGFFDGVHLGHRRILQKTIEAANNSGGLSLAVTFDRHPSFIVAPERVPALIQPLGRKLEAIANVGLDATLLLGFDKHLSEATGEAFTRQVVAEAGTVDSVCVGERFRFGRNRLGDVNLLRRLGEELGFQVYGLSAVELDGAPISSTRIRNTIATGDMALASRMLGWPYAISGAVIKGDQLGRQIGFPTANIDVDGLVLPPHGVYFANVEIAGCTRAAVINIGLRPTLKQPAPQLRVEAHVIDFDGDLYGRELDLVIGQKLRGEKRFPDLSALKNQIGIDVAAARRVPTARTGTSPI